MAHVTKKQIETFLRGRNLARQKCRTNLLALCKVLGYDDVSKKVHGPIIKALQKFPGGEDKETKDGRTIYKPFKQLWELEGSRQTLILYPRGHLKTTLISQAHLIQWIINFPNIRILLSCYTGDQVENVIRKVKGVFQYNEDFRMLFPEFCPPAQKSADFGTKDAFTVPCRTQVRGEPTVFSVTVGKTIAGYHPDVIFHSDLVDKENVKTPGGIKDVNSHFDYMNPLLERYNATETHGATRGWVIVEGTPYDFGDLHTRLAKSEAWNKVIESADPEDRKDRIPLWPERFPPDELKRIEKEIGSWMYSAQYRMKCIPTGSGLCTDRDVVFVPSEVIRGLLSMLRLHVTIDMAGMDTVKTGDSTAITLGGFDKDGRLYVIEIFSGRFPQEQIIEILFDLARRYPQIIDFKIEAEVNACILLPPLTREMNKRNKFFTITTLKRDTTVSKKKRIYGLRHFFLNHNVRFNNDIPTATKVALIEEVIQFPSEAYGVHDDILDTLADQLQGSEGDGSLNPDVIPDAPRYDPFGQSKPSDRFLGFREGDGVSQWLYGNDEQTSGPISMTVFLN